MILTTTAGSITIPRGFCWFLTERQADVHGHRTAGDRNAETRRERHPGVLKSWGIPKSNHGCFNDLRLSSMTWMILGYPHWMETSRFCRVWWMETSNPIFSHPCPVYWHWLVRLYKNHSVHIKYTTVWYVSLYIRSHSLSLYDTYELWDCKL